MCFVANMTGFPGRYLFPPRSVAVQFITFVFLLLWLRLKNIQSNMTNLQGEMEKYWLRIECETQRRLALAKKVLWVVQGCHSNISRSPYIGGGRQNLMQHVAGSLF